MKTSEALKQAGIDPATVTGASGFWSDGHYQPHPEQAPFVHDGELHVQGKNHPLPLEFVRFDGPGIVFRLTDDDGDGFIWIWTGYEWLELMEGRP